MKLVRVELEWEDGSIERLSGDAAEDWHRQTNGACAMAWAHGTRNTELPWETVRAKTHDVPDDMDPVERRVLENSKAFDALLPELRKTLAGRGVVVQDQQVVKDFATLEEAYTYALERYGSNGGFAICGVDRDWGQYVTYGAGEGAAPSPLSSVKLEAMIEMVKASE